MAETFTAACVQMNSGDDVARNLARAGELLARAAGEGAALAALPEYFALISADETRKLAAAEQDGAGPIQDFLSAAAARHKIYLAGGALPIAAENGRVRSACPLYAPSGERIARYDKIHLFRFLGRECTADETGTVAAGDAPVCAQTPLGKIGLAVCYDLRFPELFRAMDAPDIIIAPSAFTRETGAAHWELLLRARAVENLAHIIAPAQAGEHPGGRKTFGNSLIADGWGRILAAANTDGDEVIFAEINGAEREEMRRRLPALSHRKIAP
ncbi:MAG: carbon-nitrogen hydrolase family protein [Gammaproteobacteria bacterium]